MLNAIPRGITNSSRIVVMRHPNAQDCLLYRKRVLREGYRGASAPDDTVAGLPTLGGAAVLDSEDEADVDWYQVGDGRALFCGTYQGGKVADNDGALVPEGSREALAEPTLSGAWVADKHDLLMVMPGAGLVLVYEVVGVVGAIDIPPYTRKLVLNPRDDLAYIPEVEADLAGNT